MLFFVSTLMVSGCSQKDPPATPVACLEDEQRWLRALAEAPGPVMIEGTTRLSACLPPDQEAARQEEVGLIAVSAAVALARGARGEADPAGPAGARAALEAGYLVGALEKGADRTQGIHATLVNRVESAATNGLGDAAPEVRAAYGRGHEAGLESG